MMRLVNFAAAVAATCALQGCTFTTMHDRLPMLLNQQLESAVEALGLPNQSFKIDTNTVYVWDNSFGSVIPIYSPTTSTTTGTIGTTPISATTTTGSTSYMPVQYHCQIKLQVDRFNTIKRTEYFGNRGGCQRYASALKRLVYEDITK